MGATAVRRAPSITFLVVVLAAAAIYSLDGIVPLFPRGAAFAAIQEAKLEAGNILQSAITHGQALVRMVSHIDDAR